MKQTIIGIDIDDVTLELVSAWLQRYNFDHNDSLTESDIRTWDIGAYTKIGNRMYDYLKDPMLYAYVRPVKDSFWGIQTLRNMDFRVVFITSSSIEQSGVKYNLLFYSGYIEKREDYFEATDKSLIKCDYLVDDKIENVESSHGQGIVYTREWNKNLIGYPRVNSWTEIVDYFAKVKNTVDIIGV